MKYHNIPLEMRAYPQWVVWRFQTVDSKVTKVPYLLTGETASVNKPNTWHTYDEVCRHTKDYDGIGFILTENDPYCFIDLDYTEDASEFKKQQTIYNNFLDTYCELSPSGKGLHIICKGLTEHGRRRGCVEIYSSLRFMTMTGDVYNLKPITDGGARINNLFNELGGVRKEVGEIEQQDEELTDEELYKIAIEAKNGEKFYDLYNGNWQQHYNSQSEADHALINMLSFYSRNFGQIARLFRASHLGKRAKASRDDYVNGMILRSFDNYIPAINVDEVRALAENIKTELGQINNTDINLQLLTLAQLFPNEIAHINTPLPDLSSANLTYDQYAVDVDFETLPKGLVKEMARFIYAQSPRPVKTISIITALALMSGICGRAYNISGTGLNNYFVLLAPTGIGKEGISKGINRLISAIEPEQPQAKSFVGLGELVSGISLLRYLSDETQSCVTVQGEFGMTMQRMTGRNATPHMLQLRKIILDLYGKSGHGEVMRGTVYADKLKNINEIKAPNFTLLAESTPSTFFDALSDGLVDEGLISRFNIVECGAKRPPLNKNHNTVQVPTDLKDYLLNLASNCLTLNATNQVIDIDMTPQAEKILNGFDVFCDKQINDTPDESYRQLWNRGHLKSLKIAGLFAIADNIYKPVITDTHASFAIKFVRDSIQYMYNKYNTCEIGEESISAERQAIDLSYIIGGIILNSKTENFENPLMQAAYVLPYRLLMQKVHSRKSFKCYQKGGVALCLKTALQNLVDEGLLVELKPHFLKQNYNYSGRGWAINNSKHFIKCYNDGNYNEKI